MNFSSFTEIFRHIVLRYPDRPAVVTNGDNVLSYADLDAKAQSIAAIILPGTLVAINIEKSADYLAALLGCWYAGAAFMPLDPALPLERRNFILRDARPDLILTPQKLEALAPAAFTPAALQPDTLAYVIYTSGSTGQPKGVMVTHRGLPGMLQAQIDAFELTPDSRSLFYLSTNFDASVSDIGTALLSGAALCIETGNRLDTASRLPDIVRARGITYLDIPPSLLCVIKPDSMPDTLKTIVIGGEACPVEVVRAWARRFRIINVYGPTEATVCTSMGLCDSDSWDKPLIGRSLPGVDYFIFDEELQLQNEGELYIGGTQLAKGYLNRADLTALKFVTLNGVRLYRTGDLVRRQSNGDIEFLGRIDRQVKLRGQLIELEEIEAHILRQSGISRAAVLKRQIDGRDALVAYICAENSHESVPALIKSALKAVLPSWMIPSHIIVLDALPLMTSGKINFTALQSLPLAATEQKRPKNAILTEQEKTLLSFWQRILKRTDIHPDDDFFILGGDSFAVLELTLEAEQNNIPLTPAVILEFPTIAGQAAWIKIQGVNLQSGAMSAEALKKDIAFDEEWLRLLDQAQSRPPTKNTMKNVFFTGGTGFLGARLLMDLLPQTNAHFHVLVRANDGASAKKRLRLPAQFEKRVTVICGDLSQAMFGLPLDQWRILSETIDTIIHCGAWVNMVLPYEALRGANVEATQHMLRFACAGIRKTLHYVSTLSVFVSTDQNTGTVYEHDRLEKTKTVYGGYGQSKWAAEYCLNQVPAAACDIFIYRLGLITGDTKTGLQAGHDFLAMFVKGLISLGSVPAGDHEHMMVDITPVDYTAHAMTKLITKGSPGIYHIANKKGFSLAQILRGLHRQGHDITVIPAAQWQADLEKRRLSPAESASFMALCRCLPEDIYQRYRVMDLFQATAIAFDTVRTDAVLAGTGLTVPAADDALLDLYLSTILKTALAA